MSDRTSSVPEDEERKQQARKKENNPFDEQEKHGPNAQQRAPQNAEEYQGNPSVQRQSLGPSSSGCTSSVASEKSVSRPNWRFSSRFARNRTSNASMSSSTLPALASMAGTTTKVRHSGGMPVE